MTVCAVCDHVEPTHTRDGCKVITDVGTDGRCYYCGCPSYEPDVCEVCAGHGCADCNA